MAVIAGGTTGLELAWNTDLDNQADRLLELQDQHGRVDAWVPDQGYKDSARAGFEAAEVIEDQNTLEDGATDGSNTLTSASNPFTAGMVGEEIDMGSYGKRTIATFVGAGEITFSGSAIMIDTGIVFRVPLGITGGNRTLSGTAGYPFASRRVDDTDVQSSIYWLVGRKVEG